MSRYFAIGALAAAGCLGATLAVGAGAEEPRGRYTISPADGGFVRLDTETGAMSFCSGKEETWACKPMPDAEQKLQSRVDDLERENRALKDERRLAERGSSGAAPPLEGDTAPPLPPGELPMPNERDVDKLFDYVEGMVNKFKERIQRLEKEAQKEQTPL